MRAELPAELLDDPDVSLGLETLRAVARGERDGEQASPSAHVAAAKALVAYGEARVAAARAAAAAASVGKPEPAKGSDSANETPLTAEDVAAMLRVV